MSERRMFRVDSKGTANEAVIFDTSQNPHSGHMEKQRIFKVDSNETANEAVIIDTLSDFDKEKHAKDVNNNRFIGGWALKYADSESGREIWMHNPTEEEVESSDYFIDEMGNAYNAKTGSKVKH